MQMFDPATLVRPSVAALQPYSSARDDFQGTARVFLDANESPYGGLNRYPDPDSTALRAVLADYTGTRPAQILVGNGSDELIDLLFRAYCEPAKDAALICPPTYGMYEVVAGINNVAVARVPLTADFTVDVSAVLERVGSGDVKLLWLCSPNNPTGNAVPLEQVAALAAGFAGLVVVDEAYVDFAPECSAVGLLPEFKNVVVLRTLSKAWGLAAARIGYAVAAEEVLSYMRRIKPPYNVSKLNQQAALAALADFPDFQARRSTLLQSRAALEKALSGLEGVERVFPSQANFVLVKLARATEVYEALKARGIVVRNRSGQIPDTLRITVGTPDENRALLTALKEVLYQF